MGIWSARTYDNAEAWGSVREKGLPRFLLVDGLLNLGGRFALFMFIVGFPIQYFYRGEKLTDYLMSPMTWYAFSFFYVFFGLFMGFSLWYTNNKRFRPSKD